MKDNMKVRNKRVDFKDYKKPSREYESKTPLRRCFNCGDKNHSIAKCPTRNKGFKCFKCEEYGHIASNCPAKEGKAKDSCSVSRVSQKKCLKDVYIGDCKFSALVDTGSDISLMRAEQFIKVGAPKLNNNIMHFRGIGSDNNSTLGQFLIDVSIDGVTFPIKFNVVSDTLMNYGLIIVSDFLRSVEVVIRDDSISINRIEKNNSDEFSEISEINVEHEVDIVDLSYIGKTEHRNVVQDLIENYKPNKIREVGIKMNLILQDEVPVYERPRRLPVHDKIEVDKQIESRLNTGIIRPSNSDYASPIVLVKKKNGATRICVDYRQLNRKVIKDRYPLPLIDDKLDALQGATVFSTLDLKNGFFHVPIDESSIKYTAFIVPSGHYEFLRMPFGLCNSPAVFQKFINAVFKELIAKGTVLTYMDDLIIPSIEFDDGVEKLKSVLYVASQFGLIINWDKCRFLQNRVEYLGHIVENGNIQPSEHKTKAVCRFPKPQCVKDVRSFLGLTGYFRKFIYNYSLIARPLTELLKHDVKFEFGEKEYNAFEELKLALVSKPVLRLYRTQAETELHTDASSAGYGAMLLQRDSASGNFHPVYYSSGKTTPAEEKYASYELEILAIVKALKKFRVYLLGIPFKIVTDCRAFTMTMKKKDLCVRVARWALLLEEFQYTIEHRSGKNMAHVDALSRNPLPTIMLVQEKSDGIIVRMKKAQQEDNDLQFILNNIKRYEKDGYIIKMGILYKQVDDTPLIVVPKSMQAQIIRRAHEQGHFGKNKTETLVKRDFWFKGMRSKIEKVVQNCISCIVAERKHGKSEGWLNPIDKGDLPLDTFHIDHIGPLPSSRKSYRHILVVVDAFSKYVWLYPTKSTDSAEVIRRLSMQAIIFGNPKRIISDRGTAFTSNAFEDYCKKENINHTLITTGVPRANGQVERINRTLIPLLTKLSAPKPEEWYKYVEKVQQCINATSSRSTGTTPFHLLFGVHMKSNEDMHLREMIEEEWMKIFQDEREDIRKQAKEKIAEMQEQNRKTYNKKRKDAKIYKEGELVAIKRTQSGPGLKLHPKFMGPYRISKVLRNNRYLVHKVGEHEGPYTTSTAADFMKPWFDPEDEDLIDFENECKTSEDRCPEDQDGRV